MSRLGRVETLEVRNLWGFNLFRDTLLNGFFALRKIDVFLIRPLIFHRRHHGDGGQEGAGDLGP